MALDDDPSSTSHTESTLHVDDDVIYLRSLLGNAFVEWVLNDSGAALSADQTEAARALAKLLKEYSAKNPAIPIGHTASWLAFYQESSGTTFINYCRRHVGGSMEVPADSSSDRLLTTLIAFAAECYGEMLLPTYLGSHGPDFFHYARTNVGRNVVDAIYDEGIFPVGTRNDYDLPPGEVTGDYVRSLLPGRFASGLIWCAWNLAKLDVGTPTLLQLTTKIPTALAELRSCFSGRTTKVTAMASLTGVRLSGDIELSGTWGRLRPARTEDHPSTVRQFIDKRTTTTTEDGA